MCRWAGIVIQLIFVIPTHKKSPLFASFKMGAGDDNQCQIDGPWE